MLVQKKLINERSGKARIIWQRLVMVSSKVGIRPNGGTEREIERKRLTRTR